MQNTTLKLFKVTSDTKVYAEKFVDWYHADTSERALELAREDAHRYGLPVNTQFNVVECDPETLKPI